jgi:BMFP domain-containing protein YqiC
MQTDNPLLDAMARLFTDAAGAAQSLRGEIESVVRARMEKFLADMDLVPREEFEAVKAMAAKARAENTALAERIAALEARQTAAVADLPAQDSRAAAQDSEAAAQNCGNIA